MIDVTVAPRVHSVQVGGVAPLGPHGVPSGFVKVPVAGPVQVRTLNLDGDRQADLSVHGGPDKAVYAYPLAHYAAWRADLPEHAAKLLPGAFGENLTLDGLVEDDLCAGDVHAIGSAVLQVAQPRQPCFKLGLRFDDNRLPRRMVRAGRSGWYYRVLKEGVFQAGDAVRLIARPNPTLPFAVLVTVVYRGQASAEDLEKIAAAEGVAEWLRVGAARALGDRGLARTPA